MKKFLTSLVDRFFDELADRIADRLAAATSDASRDIHIGQMNIANDDRYTDFERALLAKRAMDSTNFGQRAGIGAEGIFETLKDEQ
jgi:hypothetical protein